MRKKQKNSLTSNIPLKYFCVKILVLSFFLVVTSGRVIAQEVEKEAIDIKKSISAAQNGAITKDELAHIIVKEALNYNQEIDSISKDEIDFKRFKSTLGKVILRKAEDLLSNSTTESVLPLENLGRKLLFRNDRHLIKLQALISLAKEVSSASLDATPERIKWLRNSAKNPVEKRIIEKQIALNAHRIAQSQFSRGVIFDALRTLSRTIESSRSGVELTLAENILKEIIKTSQKNPKKMIENWIFDEKSVLRLIEQTEKFNPNIGFIIGNLYELRTIHGLESDNISDLKTYYYRTINYRKDPNTENDQLRLKIANLADTKAERELASSVIKEISKNSLNNSLKLKFLFKGLYGFGFLMLVCIFVGSLAAAIVIVIYSIFQTKKTETKIKEEFEKGDPTGAASQSIRAHSSASDEYGRLLSIFGLPDSASEAQIKSAYREMIKAHHPDNFGGKEVNNDKFIELKTAYERIFEIRKSFFGGS